MQFMCAGNITFVLNTLCLVVLATHQFICTFIRKWDRINKVLLQRLMKHEQANRGLTDLCSISARMSARKAR